MTSAPLKPETEDELRKHCERVIDALNADAEITELQERVSAFTYAAFQAYVDKRKAD